VAGQVPGFLPGLTRGVLCPSLSASCAPSPRRISAFVLGPGCIRALNAGRGLRWRPAPTRWPALEGQGGRHRLRGCAGSHIAAMRGKGAGGAAAPQRHALEAVHAGQLRSVHRRGWGCGRRLQQSSAGARRGGAAQPQARSTRCPFERRDLHRRTPHGSMTAQHIHLEPVVGNQRRRRRRQRWAFSTNESADAVIVPVGTTLGQVAGAGPCPCCRGWHGVA
jgi:hypothetical protein